MKRKGCKIKKFQLGGIELAPSEQMQKLWANDNLPANMYRQPLTGEILPVTQEGVFQMDQNQMVPGVTPDSPYQVNQKPLNQTKTNREFGLNAKNFAGLQTINGIVNGIGNLYNQGQQNQSIINQNPLSSMQFSNGRSNQSKYGYSFKKGGFKWDNEDDDFLFGDDEETANVAEQPRTNDEEVIKEELQPEIKQKYDWNNDPLDLLQSKKRVIPQYQPIEQVNYNSIQPSQHLSLDNQQAQVYQHLKNKGLTKEAIAGIMGNIQHESNFNSGIPGDNGTSFGLFQHHADRKNNLLNYLNKRGLPANSVQGQIDFALQENPSIVKELNQAKTPQQAADIWVRKFEVPANVDKQSQLRQKASLNYYQDGGLINKTKVKQFLKDNGNPTLSKEDGVRANYDPVTNTIHYNNDVDLIPEFTHVVQKMNGNIGGNSVPPNQSTMMMDNNQNLEVYPTNRDNLDYNRVNQDAGYLNDLRLKNTNSGYMGNAYVKKAFGSIYPQSYLNRLNDSNIYMTPGSAEYEAHQLIEPSLNNYLNYQKGGTKVNFPKFDPTLIQQKPIIENTNPIKRKPIVQDIWIDPQTGLPITQQKANLLLAAQRNQNPGSITKTIPKSTKKKIVDVVSNPMTSAQQLINKQSVTGRGPRNVYDNALDIVNPVTYAKAIKNTTLNVVHPIETTKKLTNTGLGILGNIVGDNSTQSIMPGVQVGLDALMTAQAVKSLGIPFKTNFNKYLTQEEAVQARAERMLSQKDKWIGQPEDLSYKFKNAIKNHNSNSTYPGEKLGTNTGNSTEISKFANLSEANKARVAGHETGHYYRNTFNEGKDWNKSFDFSDYKQKTRDYLSGKGMRGRGSIMGDEIRERAAQLKDYIAQKNNIPLNKNFEVTESQLNDAIKNYVKDTGLDNTMSTMLNSLKDKKSFLQNINKYALTTLPIIGTGILSQKKLGGKMNDNNGYLTSNLHNFTPKKIINSNHITSENLAFPIVANNVPIYPNTGDYIFPTNKVVERPLYLTGGIHYVDNATIINLKQKKVKFKYV